MSVNEFYTEMGRARDLVRSEVREDQLKLTHLASAGGTHIDRVTTALEHALTLSQFDFNQFGELARTMQAHTAAETVNTILAEQLTDDNAKSATLRQLGATLVEQTAETHTLFQAFPERVEGITANIRNLLDELSSLRIDLKQAEVQASAGSETTFKLASAISELPKAK